MPKVYGKVEVEENVLVAARRRFAELYRRFDLVAVSFSGGKDSTVCLNLAIEAARDAGKLPVKAAFWDEEAIPPDTVEYCERVRRMPEVDLSWVCAPIKHRNACSRDEPYWHCWDPAKRDLWCRPMPDGAITDFPGFYFGASMPDVAHRLYGPENGMVCIVRGIRASESIRRYRSVCFRKDDNWITSILDGYAYQASPIYDWNTIDVWTAPRELGWDYNRAYDVMKMAGVAPHHQRACPPYGEEPLQRLWTYAVCWPDLWHKMVKRVPGAGAAGRYCGGELYGHGIQLPGGQTWRSWTFAQIEMYPEPYRGIIAGNVSELLALHKKKTKRPVTEDQPDPASGLCWKFLATMVNRGDLKQRRMQNVALAGSAHRTEGSTLEDFVDASADARY
jgi:predicted phosphoadenosine phosphosulfate sulfurtransferase